MKIQIIGDIHGSPVWKNIIDLSVDKIIFLGDYVDAFEWQYKPVEVLTNFIELLDFVKEHKEKIILLWGNHDIQYMLVRPTMKNNYTCSGYNITLHYQYYDLFNDNIDLFKVSWQYKNHLFTHAGVHCGWWEYHAMKDIKELGIENICISEQLETLFYYRKESMFMCDLNRYGRHKVGGPLWLSKELAYKKPLPDMHQYVGHTATNEPKYFIKNKNTSINFFDCLERYDKKIIIDV